MMLDYPKQTTHLNSYTCKKMSCGRMTPSTYSNLVWGFWLPCWWKQEGKCNVIYSLDDLVISNNIHLDNTAMCMACSWIIIFHFSLNSMIYEKKNTGTLTYKIHAFFLSLKVAQNNNRLKISWVSFTSYSFPKEYYFSSQINGFTSNQRWFWLVGWPHN